MLSRTALTLALFLLAGCVTSGSEHYQTVDSLKSQGLSALSGEEMANLLSGNTLTGEYVTTPSANFENQQNKWMEFYNTDGSTDYRYCSAKKNSNWSCAKKVIGAWKIEADKLCFSYDNSAIHDRCFQIYAQGSEYLLAATNFKSAGYVRARITKISKGYVEDSPFSTH